MRTLPDYRPRLPRKVPRIGLIGAGSIARTAHLPAYAKWGIDVAAIASRTPGHARRLAAEFSTRAAPSVHALLEDPEITAVDIATGPDARLDLIEESIRAGKHVLAQKPLVMDPAQIPRLHRVLAEAKRRGVLVAVNQNGRWAPAWRLATLLIRENAIGEIVGVTHLHDKPLPPLVDTRFDQMPHMLITDYLAHWIDITRCWLEGTRVSSVTAHESRVPGQPDNASNPWHASIHIGTTAGASASIRVVGDAATGFGGCPFWIHGTRGTLRGSILRDSDRLELDSGDTSTRFPLKGQWFTDGFAGAMGELLLAAEEGRQPENSAAHVLASARIAIAATKSTNLGGRPVDTEDLNLTRPGDEEGGPE